MKDETITKAPQFFGGDGTKFIPGARERHERHVRVLDAIEEHGAGALDVLIDSEDIPWAKLWLDPATPASAWVWDAVPL